MSEQIKRYNYVCAIDDYEEAGDGEMVTFADHAARVFDLEHRLANCDADLHAMQQAKELAERRLEEQRLSFMLRLDKAGADVGLLIEHCPDSECCVCGQVACPHGEPLHFHHDGCPACEQEQPA